MTSQRYTIAVEPFSLSVINHKLIKSLKAYLFAVGITQLQYTCFQLSYSHMSTGQLNYPWPYTLVLYNNHCDFSLFDDNRRFFFQFIFFFFIKSNIFNTVDAQYHGWLWRTTSDIPFTYTIIHFRKIFYTVYWR